MSDSEVYLSIEGLLTAPVGDDVEEIAEGIQDDFLDRFNVEDVSFAEDGTFVIAGDMQESERTEILKFLNERAAYYGVTISIKDESVHCGPKPF